jgi:bifunctional non-homologous end joining protein LigD
MNRSSQNDSVINNLLKKGKKSPFYTSVQPMLATLVDKAFDKDEWTYEVKWDGYRAVAFMNKGIVEIKSRNNKSFNAKYYPVFEALTHLGVNAVVDGEIVVVTKQGSANFNALQNWRSEADGELLYYLFDILWFEGIDIKGLPLTERKEILSSIIPQDSIIRLSNHFNTSGIEFLETARKMGLEGIMAKKKDSTYQPGNRTKDWLKIKANKRQEVVIGGFTLNEGSRKPFSSVLVGVFDNGKFIYTGKIGTGFDTKTQIAMMQQFKPYITNKPPFDQKPDINKPSRFRPDPPNATATWMEPVLVCEVSFTELTPDGIMRHPSFEGMRADKNATDVGLEKETKTAKIVSGIREKDVNAKHQDGSNNNSLESNTGEDKKNIPADEVLQPVSNMQRRTLLNPTEKTQVKIINGKELKFTNLDKMFWPDLKITKRDLINYYYKAAEFILPYIKDRPMTLKRYPDGIEGFHFYQKDVKGKVPAWVKTCHYYSETDKEDKKYLLANDEETLLLIANYGSIELHPWNSTARKPDYPTWCIIDLDPDKNSFEQVITAAQVTKEILDELGVPSYPKTSGSTGLHIYIPLGARYTYDQCQEFGRVIATLVHHELPEFTTIERMTANRGGKMYIDYLQNRPHATVAGPYSLRPKPGAPVSMPLHWDEVKTGLKVTDFNILNAIERMNEVGDIFREVIGKGIELKKIGLNRTDRNR